MRRVITVMDGMKQIDFLLPVSLCCSVVGLIFTTLGMITKCSFGWITGSNILFGVGFSILGIGFLVSVYCFYKVHKLIKGGFNGF